MQFTNADPVNPNYVYATGVNFWVSTDGGKNFSIPSGQRPHADHHGFATDPRDHKIIYTVCDGGIYRSTNRGASGSWTFIGEGIANVEFYDIANARTQPGLVIGGTQDNGTVRYDGASTLWTHIRGGDGSTVDINPTNAQILYAMNQFACSIARKIGSDSWSAIACQLPTAPACRDLHYQLHPTTPTTVLACCDRSLWRTTNPTCDTAPNCNNGTLGTPQRWSRIYTPTVADGGVQRVAVDASIDLYYAGSNNGRVFAGPSGASFQRVFTHPGNRGVTDIEIDPDEPTVFYASFGGSGANRIFRFRRTSAAPTDAEVNEIAIDTTLRTGISVRTIAVDRNAPLTLYAGTTKGVYRGRSSDGGANWTWTFYNEGMPPAVDVKDLEVHPTTGVIRAATLGRGAYEVNTSHPIGSVLAAEGRITLLRIHDVGTGFGPPGDTINGEVIVRLDTHPGKAFGFTLRTGSAEQTHRAMTDALRAAFAGNDRVRLEYVRIGIDSGRIARVMNLP